MNIKRNSMTKNQNILLIVFLKSFYYSLPFGTFLIACNCMFESVRNYYFDWMIVVLPTMAVCVIAILCEMIVIYQQRGFLFKRKNVFLIEKDGYLMSNKNLVTS